MGPLLSPLHESPPPRGPRIVCPMGPRCSSLPYPPSALLRSLSLSLSSPCARREPLTIFLSLRFARILRCLRRRCLAATCHRSYPAAPRCAMPLLRLFFHPPKEASRFFSRSSSATASKNLLALRRLTLAHHLFKSNRSNERRDARLACTYV